MNLNVLSYCIYLPLTFYVTIVVGWICYKNGKNYLYRVFHGDNHLVDSVSRLLLTGYYLFNLGYAAVNLKYWKTITTVTDLIGEVGGRIGFIVLGLGIMHYINLALTSWYGKKYCSNSAHSKSSNKLFN